MQEMKEQISNQKKEFDKQQKKSEKQLEKKINKIVYQHEEKENILCLK